MAASVEGPCAAILVAAGAGERLGAGVPKAFVEIAGRTLFEHALATFRSHPGIDALVAVVPADRVEQVGEAGVTPVAGGATRQDSVAAGLAALPSDVQYVLVHDVARPFVPASVIDSVLAALHEGADAVVPVVPIADTVRRVDAAGTLAGVVDRATLVAVQTPQGFRRDLLLAAHAAASGTATDDASLVEALGHSVVAVPGADSAFKITTPGDLARAASIPGGLS